MIALRLAALELRRIAVSRRWSLAVLACGVSAWLSVSSVKLAATNAGLQAGAIDVFLAAANAVPLVGYLLIPAFALLAAGSLAADRTSGYASLVAGRAGSRRPWWIAKCTAIACAAVAVQLLLLATTVTAGLAAGLPLSPVPSQLATARVTEESDLPFAPSRGDDDMYARAGRAAGLLALAFTAFGVLGMAISVRTGREYVPVAVTLGIVFFDWLIVRLTHWDLYDAFSPTLHLLESASPSAVSGQAGWWISIAYFVAVLVLSGVFGMRALSRAEL